MSNLSKVSEFFQQFIDASNFKINFENISTTQWMIKDIPLVMMLALRSQTDVLSGEYSTYDAFIKHISTINIVDFPVTSRGEVMSTEDWDNMKSLYDITKREFPYSLTTLRSSRHLFNYTTFLESLGMNSQEGYLETRSWFCRNPELQKMTINAVLQGDGQKIDVKASNYRDHITSLLRVT